MRESALVLAAVYVVAIAILLLCAFLVPTQRVALAGSDAASNEQAARETFRNAVPAHDSARRDCANEMVFSVLDAQCDAVCRGPDAYISRNGICVNAITQNPTAVRNECSAEKGVLAYLIGDPQFGKADLLCLSVDPGIQPDDPTKPNRICVNGNIDIDYRKSYPTVEQCRCPSRYKAVRIPATSSVRERAICLPEAIANALSVESF